MYHKFKDYNRNEQREIVFELIRQKYLYDPQLNNFGSNTKYLIGLVKDFQSDQISASDLKERLEFFYKKLRKDIADEIYYYFYNIAEVNAEKGNTKFATICKIISNIINIDAISSSIQVPEDKMDKLDNNGGSFMMQTFRKYPAPAGYTPPPPPPPMHNFKNPYTSKDFKSICDYMRYKIFDEIIDNKIENFEDLDELSPAYSLIPDKAEFIKFPQVEDEDGDEEDLDFENPGEFVINSENSITFSGGGDWQEPKTFSMKWKNGKVEAFDIEDGYDDGNLSGAEDVIRIICELFGLDKDNYDYESTDPNDLVKLYNDMVTNKDFKLNTEPETETFDVESVTKPNNPTNIEEKLQTTLKELQEEFEEDFDDFGGMYYNAKTNSVWLDVCDGFEPEDEVEKKFLKVVSKVIIQYEKDPYSDQNQIDLDWKEIKDNPTSNKVQKFEDFDDEFINEFPYKKVLGCATIYRKESFGNDFDGNWGIDTSDKDEMRGYKKYPLPKGERIAIGEQNWDNGNAEISEIIVITKDTFYWNYDSGWISDGIITIEIERHKGYVPAQEPVDLLETGYENGGGGEIPNKKKIKKMVEKYKLDHVLMSM